MYLKQLYIILNEANRVNLMFQNIENSLDRQMMWNILASYAIPEKLLT